MKKLLVATAVLLSLSLSIPAYSQSNFGVSGTVSDSSGALIPGVAVTANNTATGVVSETLTNESGVYNFASVQPGVYKLTATLPGFQPQSYSDVQAGNSMVRLNFTLKIATGGTTVGVTIAADQLLAANSPSIGEVLTERKIMDLPLVGNNVIDLITVMSGVNFTAAPIFGANDTTFAGLDASNINIQVNGVTASAGGRYRTGVQTATMINPDMVSEIRLILAPVDAESGNGNGQIQIVTRSGTNRYSGSAVWSVNNSALNARPWANTRNPTPIPNGYANVQQLTLSYSGPIIKNKTFFFVNVDGNRPRSRGDVNPTVLTPCAKNGIFRFWDTGSTVNTGTWNNGNINQTTSTGTAAAIAVVDYLGNPSRPALNPNGTVINGTTAFTGSLKYYSVFGPLASDPTKADCSDAKLATGGAPWDTFRRQQDTTGFVQKINAIMPAATNFDTGDGLNTAGHRWVRTLKGTDNLFGIGEQQIRNQINTKIDQNFNSNNRLNVSMSYERSKGEDQYMNWPDTFGGGNFRHPLTVSTQFTSTLSPAIVNESRVGYNHTGGNNLPPFFDPRYGPAANEFYNLKVDGIPVYPQLGTGGVNFQSTSSPLGTRGFWPARQYDRTSLMTLADTLSWTKGKHSLRTGIEVRISRSLGGTDGGFGTTNVQIRATGGDAGNGGANIPTAAINGLTSSTILVANQPGLGSANNTRMRNLLDYLSGSLTNITQLYFMQDATKLDAFDDFRTHQMKELDYHQNAFNVFVKDDWKVTKRLTLNLGLRYEYYGVPFIKNGLTPSLIGGGYALFGISGRDGFSDWMNPPAIGPGAGNYDPNLVSAIQFVGPGSLNPKEKVWPSDMNNFGPAIGFAWQMPWFGADKTTIRGGYQVTYQGAVQVDSLNDSIGNTPGSSFAASYNGTSANPYLDLATVMASPVSLAVPNVKPMQPILIGTTGINFTAYDPNRKSPYVQNVTMSLARSLHRNVSVEIRYVGNMAVKQNKTIDLNTNNFLYNGLKEAFDSIRAGGESPLLDSMFKGINIVGTGFGPIGQVLASNGVMQTAGLQMRASGTYNASLANGAYNTLAGNIAAQSYTAANNPTLPVIPASVQRGSALRNSGLFPANFIEANPQFGTANYSTNLGHTNYHSIESQITVRPIHGISWQGTHTWQKTMGTPGSFTNPVDRSYDGYFLLSGGHQFRSNGTFELPIGPNKLLFGNSSGPLARAIEKWQTSWIMNLNGGSLATVSGSAGLYANGRPDLVGAFPVELAGNNSWVDGATSTNYFPTNTFVSVPDPQCSNTKYVAASLASLCTNDALALRNPDGSIGPIVLQNSLPGVQGTLGSNTLRLAGSWTLNASASKAFRISESKTAQIRIDTNNVLNHPQPAAPVVGINNAVFGNITTKSGSRTFQGQLRLSF